MKLATSKARPRQPRIRRTAQQWQALIAEQQRSGLSVPAFSQREGLSAQTLWNWQRRLGRPNKAAGDQQGPSFIEIGGTPHRPLAAGLRVRLELGGGVVLELSGV